jgi:hypothetical protein
VSIIPHSHQNIGDPESQQRSYGIKQCYRYNKVNTHLRMFNQTTTEHTFFSVAQGIFFKIDNILGHKASLNKHKKV